ncbi:MAG: thiamine pyrophosphate-dependent dehydrogenase E1 component subunit alpha [Halomonas sp.]|jgi:2-oxoisovalerate dehydrogenase E1 component alpha subunit|uniref:2-oxoisovalerate dehydrogenase subunit alpha n=1 Tax=Billgrantia tianxiuensis TaxID=2497861 RepID=A0A6I6SQJ8_9GAMM|nr:MULTISPECIES: thiamine pyrophosphate-dependent dehydrogenase E1 component subunit alpha [Halomonas]MCE8031810.1 thiamine pyrophosphate-dependent dehydrogenase E1 component subunit alpha [Halomonas sp. MCCC 1A11057]MDX5435137.1 thiamine pyrophosphate-dependent dehydrogenase E1 component subunit alpha [Halomonas sp.]MDX5504286.1 thiamine pyrophosphate-dependent dehydrogenase E1 component subunit alpha [Halomonas sp.]QHC50090.1 thiamine pyrophosphate-dependent dehydrogenase E1 component subunit
MTTTHDVHSPSFMTGDEFHIPTFRLLQQDGTLFEGAEAPELDEEKALKIYRAMLVTRVLDERMMAAQRQGRLSFYMQCTGEEAAVIGATAALDDADMIMAQYREQGALVYRGFSYDEFMNQLFGNELDYGKGRQMPIHYGSRKLHYMTISSPLATQIPQATGYAYGQKLAGEGHCTITFFGEGAASEGDFHAALNMASVHKVPVIFFCRNNGYAISTPASEQFAADGIAPRAFGYRMHVIRVDGNDVLAVYRATQEARKLAVEMNQPVLIEAMTYRLAAHSSSDDPSGYRSRKEEEAWREKDPILRMQRWLIERGWWSEEEEKELQDSLRREVLETMKRAEKRPPPPLESLVTDVYADVTPALQRQLDALKTHIRKHPDAYPKGARSLDPDVKAAAGEYKAGDEQGGA